MPAVALPTGVSLFYDERGSGEPVLLIMGTGADHTLWNATAEVFADLHRVITYDQRGTGSSDHPPDPETYTARVLADDAAALLDALGVATAHVAGLSLGSAVAQELAINHPQKIRSLTVVGSHRMVVWDDMQAIEPIRVYDKGVMEEPYYDSFGEFQLRLRDGDIVIPKVVSQEPLKVQADAFIRRLTNGEPTASESASGVRLVACLEAIRESLNAQGRRVAPACTSPA